MSDLDTLLAAFDSGSLLRPSSETPNVVDLSRAIALLAGASDTPTSGNSKQLAETIGRADHLVFLLADGLGMDLLEGIPGGSFLREYTVSELRTVFPSTSAVALTSIATAEWPTQHGVTGWWTYLPQIDSSASLLEFVTRNDGRPLSARGLDANDVFPVPSAMQSMDRDSLALLPASMASSIYSKYFAGGRLADGYRSLQQAIDVTIGRVKEAGGTTYTYLYAPRVDKVCHLYGSRQPETETALIELDRQTKRLAEALDGRGRVVVSGDHGMLDVGQAAKHLIRPSDSLLGLLRNPPSGDARVLYLNVREGAHDNVRAYFQRRFGERFLVITVDEAQELQLFGPGPIPAPIRERFGDLMAISAGEDVVDYYSGRGIHRVMAGASHHSGLTPSEMRVPLVVV